ncbi:MAG: methyltransferase [Gemmatimonadota bacterium]
MSAPIPVIFGSDEQFARARAALAAAGYTAEAVAERTGVPAIYEFKAIYEGRKTALEITDGLDVLIRLYMDTVPVRRELVARMLPADSVTALTELGLLIRAVADPEALEGPVLLYPAEGLWIISDADANPARGTLANTREDVVYPAITRNTGRFLTFLPQRPCDQMLELCGGAGLAALRGSRHANRVWTADITARATACAEFNIRLNGLKNAKAVAGDLYDPVEGQTFDLIVAHPPHVPATEQKLIFRDAGEDGEQVTRRIIAGLPQFLRPGGRLYCICMATDRTDALLEARVREMLGPSEAEFDVVVVTMQEYDPLEYYARAAVSGRETFARVGEWYALFERLGIRRLVYSMIVVQRHRSAAHSITARRQVAPQISPREVDWLLDWEAAVRGPGMPEALLDQRPAAGAAVDLMMSLRQQGEEWMPAEVAMGTPWPFMLKVDTPVWAATLLSSCDGKATVRDHLAFFRGNGIVEGVDGEASFLRLIQILISAGILTVESHPVPQIPALPKAAQP